MSDQPLESPPGASPCRLPAAAPDGPAEGVQEPEAPGPQELVLFLVLPVHNSFPLQVLQATAHLGGIEDGSLLVEAGVAQVVNVELQVPSIHNG